MNPAICLLIYFAYSIIAAVVYVEIILPKWEETHENETWLSDILKCIPFGFFVIIAMIIQLQKSSWKINYEK